MAIYSKLLVPCDGILFVLLDGSHEVLFSLHTQGVTVSGK